MDMRFRPAHQSLLNNVPSRVPTRMRPSYRDRRTFSADRSTRSAKHLTKDIRAPDLRQLPRKAASPFPRMGLHCFRKGER